LLALTGVGVRKTKFTGAQNATILREADVGLAVEDLLRKNNNSRPTISLWWKKFGGVDFIELQRPKALEREKARLKRTYAEHATGVTAINDVLTHKQLLEREARYCEEPDSRPWFTRSAGLSDLVTVAGSVLLHYPSGHPADGLGCARHRGAEVLRGAA
jgi:putative transposase